MDKWEESKNLDFITEAGWYFKTLAAQEPGNYSSIELYHSLDGITNPKCKSLLFLTTIFFYKEKKALAFDQDRCCHPAFCL